MQKLNLHRIMGALFLATVFFLAILKIEDADAWMHLSLGRLIWETKGLPVHETFVYTALDLPFKYSSWLFGLMYYLTYLAFNIYGVILLKAITVTAAFYVLLKDSLRPRRNHVIAILVLTIMVIMVRHRFVERPDTFTMLFLAFSVFSLNAFLYENKKYVYALPFVHMLWANSHSGVVLMFAPFGAFLAGGILQLILEKRGLSFADTPSAVQLKTVLFLFLGSFAASLISPYFIGQYFFGDQVLANPFYKQEIGELLPTTWNFTKWPYLVACLTILSFILNRRRASLIHLLLVIPFIVLPLTARRFIFLEGVIAGPIIARNMASYLDSIGRESFFFRKSAAVLLAIWLIIYSAGVYSNTFTVEDIKQNYGIGVDYSAIPEKALCYMDRNGIDGRVFNLFEWGGYITWRDFPKRSVFIDPRGHIPPEIFDRVSSALNAPTDLDALEAKYGFDCILTWNQYNPDLSPFARFRDYVTNQKWALVYWDDISLLFVKKTGKYESIARRDQYSVLEINRARLHAPVYYSSVVEQLKRNILETDSVKAYTLLGSVYNETGRYGDAVDTFKAALKNPLGQSAGVYKGVAYALSHKGSLDDSIKYYKKALALREEANTFYIIGNIYLTLGDQKKALPFLENALKLNPALASAYPLLSAAYQRLGLDEKTNELSRQYENTATMREEEHLKNGMNAYRARQFFDALLEFYKSVEAAPSSPVAYCAIGSLYYDMNDLEKAFEYYKTTLDIDPQYANAHYGLALIFKKWGDMPAANAEWQEYLKLEPSGFYSRRGKEKRTGIEGK